MMTACFSLDQFGIAVERARLAHLVDAPVALAAGGRIVVVSEEAAQFGIRRELAESTARSLCPHLHLLPYDRPAYEEAARAIWDAIAVESSVVEPESPEICFAEITGTDILTRVENLAAAISRRISIPLQCGLARTKLLARRGALESFGPDRRIITVPFGREAAALARVPIREIAQIDLKTRQRLDRHGVRTLGDVLKLPRAELRRKFKTVGHLLERLALGDDGDRVRPLWPPPSIEHAVTFGDFDEGVDDSASLHAAFRLCAGELARILKARKEFCRTVVLTIGLCDRSWLQSQERLAIPCHDSGELCRTAVRLWQRMRIDRPPREVRLKAGDLGIGSALQLSLLDRNDQAAGLPHERAERLEKVLAWLRGRYGVGAVIRLSMLNDARRTGLWTYALTHRFLHEPVDVAIDAQGMPVRYWRRTRRGGIQKREVRQIQNLWRETAWFWGTRSTRTVYRVETDPAGLSELHEIGITWELGASAD